MAKTLVHLGCPDPHVGDIAVAWPVQTCVIVTTPAPLHSDTQTYGCRLTNIDGNLETPTFTGGTTIQTFGMRVRFNDLGHGAVHFANLYVGTTRQLQLWANGATLELRASDDTTVLASASGVFAIDTEYVVEFQVPFAAGLAVKVRVDGVEKINHAFQATTGTNKFNVWSRGTSQAVPVDVVCYGTYLNSNTVQDDGDFEGDIQFATFQNSASTASGRFGTAPNTGSWANCQELAGSDTNLATWTVDTTGAGVTCSEGSRTGPRNVAALSGLTFVGGTTIARAKQNSTLGAPTLTVRHGQQVSGQETTANLASSSTFNLTTAFANYQRTYTVFSAGAAYDANRWAQHGIDNTIQDTTTLTLSELCSVYAYRSPWPAGGARLVGSRLVGDGSLVGGRLVQ